MEIQIKILQFFEQIRTETLTLLMTTITIMAESLFIVAILAGLYWCVDKIKSKRLAWFVLFNFVGNGMIKNLIQMPRPFDLGVVKPIRAETATSFSFPSGHTQTATSFWSGAMLVLRTKGMYVMGSCIILLTALSRVYLGVHWPMDVLGGIFFGVIFTLLANKLLGDKGEIRPAHVIGVSIVVLLVMIFKVDADLYKGAAALWGMTCGAYIEQKYIQFEAVQNWRIQLKKILIGFGGLVLIYLILSKVLPAVKIVKMIKYALLLLWITAGAPFIFKKLK
ncbi:phosphatase PAP2 family protein [Cellulosilyticum sp. ST5]|uniref:Phosphoesterase PA-phosphatase related protein n=1 Tax=Cellulosilyticum lentocellum (strain ATCC 49066 / DSM 5427 / NCIMB 11756 / RHM5) TaxID=642492 RepID=F2JJ01_CELLD|nr:MULTISPECIES: phosphatase PAP2 family protein [Cellulosilyticum]ADZ83160.1 phosphoesterase PA-phosphatase related protein [Cellulosilyticum lentocellum DSM 5427]QEH68645.1 phosphatase PAP2 family protein [Cellulosilyticum sp. WCF-2]